MYLALLGSGEYLPPVEDLDRELIRRLPEPPRVVCLPTAAGTEGPERTGYWSQLGVEHFSRLGAAVEALPVVDSRSANDKGLSKQVAAANFIYLSGGKPAYLQQVLEGSRVMQAILEVLAGGGLLAGCSAGAMVMGERFYGFPGLRTGFNFLPGVTIVPHFDEIPEHILRPIRLLTQKDLALVGIDGNTALVRYNFHYEVLGAGAVTVWNRAGKTRYKSGPLPEDALGKDQAEVR